MIYFIVVVSSVILFIAFMVLTWHERKRGSRVLSRIRDLLDQRLTMFVLIIQRVDFSTFALHLIRDATSRIVHFLAHLSLVFVRALERILTRLVQYLKRRHTPPPVIVSRETSHFVRTIMYFKQTLRRSRRIDTVSSEPSQNEVG